jgi:CDP-diacylglycerol--glycerol-3-phosphate 3-phosphatidyltransferase
MRICLTKHVLISTIGTTPEDFDSTKVTLFPLIQAGQFNIRDEETTLKMLFEHLDAQSKGARPLLDLTSGYFGLYKEYRNLILRSSNVDCRIVAASPKVRSVPQIACFFLIFIYLLQANGFYGSRGISGRIPEGYTLLEQRFMSAVTRAGRQPSVQLNEWEREGWTYHAKGGVSHMKFFFFLVVLIFDSQEYGSRKRNAVPRC